MKTKGRVLIVDHDENALIGLERTLEEAGYTTTTTWSRDEALRLSDLPFDVLLMDEHLGDLDSAMLLEKLRQLQPNATLLLMRTRKEPAVERSGLPHPTVCKWEHDEVKARVRSHLAA
jgi:DNA-binding response OmpR family regulator